MTSRVGVDDVGSITEKIYELGQLNKIATINLLQKKALRSFSE